jgi:hypothetical protein
LVLETWGLELGPFEKQKSTRLTCLPAGGFDETFRLEKLSKQGNPLLRERIYKKRSK